MAAENQNYKNMFLILGLIGLAALLRLVPHPYNFTPIAGMALFAGRFMKNKGAAFLIPLSALLLGDLFLGFHSTMAYVYGAFAAVVLIGFLLKKYNKWGHIFSASLSSSLIFFIVSNLGVWLMGTLYTKDFSGLVTCFAAALPFFHWTLLGDLFYVGAFFGLYHWISQASFQQVKA